MTDSTPSRGEVWLVNLKAARGHEQAGIRPSVVVSTNGFNRGPAGLVVVLPVTTTPRGVPLHVPVAPSDGGLRQQSYVKCEDIRSISTSRLVERLGALSSGTLALIEDRMRILLEL